MAKLRISCPVLMEGLFSGARLNLKITGVTFEPGRDSVLFDVAGPDVPPVETVVIRYHVQKSDIDDPDGGRNVGVSLEPSQE